MFFFFFHRLTEKSTLDDSSSGQSSSSEDDELTDSDSSLSSDPYSEQPTEWSCLYDQSIYSTGIAIQKVPNSEVTVLQWLAMNFSLFTSHPAISKSTFSDYLQVQNILKSSNIEEIKMPSSYKEARSMIEPFLVQKKIYKFCVNNCIAFRNENRNLKECPKCHSVEQKRFIYLPVGPRISRIFGEESLAKLLQCHDGSIHTHSLMWDIHDSPVWKDLYSEEGYFQGNRNGISFALELDGVNPYHNVGIQYSMTPIMLTLLNLPRNVRNQFGNIFLVGVIPGSGCSEVSNVNPYIEILVDELLYLTKCKVVDAYLKAPVDIKIKVLLYVLDYPGLCKVFSQQGSGGLSGCHWCHMRGVYCSHLSKTIYLSNNALFSNQNPTQVILEDHGQPRLRDSHSETYFREAYINVRTKVDANIIASATGCKGRYALQELPGHNRLEETLPDACHTIKDVVQNVMFLVTNRNINLQKLLKAEKEYNRFDPIKMEADSAGRRHNSSKSKSSAAKGKKKVEKNTEKAETSTETLSCNIILPYMLTAYEVKVADERASSIRVPLGFGIKPGPFISKPGSLKSHDWKQLACQGILKYCLRGMLSHDCRKTLFSLLDSLSVLCAECHSLDDLEEVENQLNLALVALEKFFPLALQNITTHLLKHIVPGIRKYGPVYGTWMYVFERFNSWICKRSLNMRYPEATVMETFIIYDWCQFMVASGRMPVGYQLLDVDPDDDENDNRDETERDISDQREIKISGKELKSVHSLCTNCNGIKCRIRKQLSYQYIRPDSGRLIRFSCSNKATALTVSSYVCFERKRTNPGEKLSSGRYAVFGRVLYFLIHTGINSKQSVIACVEVFNHAHFDNDCGLWYCVLSDFAKNKFYVDVSDLSSPLVTAFENEHIWFLNSFKLPVLGSVGEANGND